MSRLNVDQIYTRTGTGTPAIREMPIVDLAVSGSQSLPSGSWNRITLLSGTKITNRDTDTNGFWSNSTNRLTPTIPGWYNLNLFATVTHTSSTAQGVFMGRNPNGAVPGGDFTLSNTFRMSTSLSTTMQVTGLIYFNGTTDYMEFFVYSLGTSPNLTYCVLQANLVRPD